MTIDKLEGWLAPARRRGFEYLDRDDIAAAVRERSHQDIVRSSALFGGNRALRLALAEMASHLPERPRVLDVGCGWGASLPIVQRTLESCGKQPQLIALDLKPSLLAPAGRYTDRRVAGSALSLPLSNGSVDLAYCTLLLHHFDDESLSCALAELNRVASSVLVVDLRRSLVAAAGIWLASWPLGFHPYSRHDGVTSVLRGFTVGELGGAIERSTGATPSVRRRAGYRIAAWWRSTAV